MKARLPINRKDKDRIREEVALEYDRQGQAMTRRVFKLFCVALNQQYGFGKDRLSRLLRRVNYLSDEAQRDEVFWTHIDTLLIEQMGMDFPREDYGVMDK